MPVIEVEDGRSEVDFIHNQVNFAHTSLHFIGYHCDDSAVFVDLPAEQHHLMLQFSWSGVAELGQDGAMHRVPQGHFLLIRPGSRMVGRLLPGYQSVVARINCAALELTLARHLGRRPTDMIHFEQFPVSIDGEGNAIASLIFSICANLESSAPLMGRSPVSLEMENMLNSLILFSLPNQYSAELESGATPVPYYVRRVETFIRENAREPLEFADLVAAAGTSTRTLHEGFRRFRNTTPMAYLRNIRLELARADLQKDGAGSVTKVALDCGFSHLSKFSLDYQRRFGERPSETLNRNISALPIV